MLYKLYDLKNKLVDFAARYRLCVEFEYDDLNDIMEIRFENPRTHVIRTFCATSKIDVEESFQSMIKTTIDTPGLIDQMEKPEWMEEAINPDPKKIFISTRNPYIQPPRIPVGELDNRLPGVIINEMSFYNSPEWSKQRKEILASCINKINKKEKDMKPTIEKVYFNNPYTVVLWSDKTKTMVKAEGEAYDPEKGLAMAICKKFLGTNKSHGNYFDEFKKWLPEERKPEMPKYLTTAELAEKTGQSVSTVRKDCAKGLHPGAEKVDGKWMIPYEGMTRRE